MYHNLGVLINLIVTQYFSISHCVFYWIENNWHISSHSVPAVIINISTTAEEFKSTNETLIDFNLYCQGFVIQSQNPDIIFDYVERQLRTQSGAIYKYNIRKYLFVVDTSETIDKILVSPHLNMVSDTLFVSPSTSSFGKIGRFDFKFYEKYNLWKTSLIARTTVYEKILLDEWSSRNGSFVSNSVLYTEETTNQRGKNLKISTCTLSPYSVIGNSLESSYGIDMRILQEYVRKYNFTPVLIVDPEKNWGLPWDNKNTTTGIVGQVVDGVADISVAGLVHWPTLMFSVDTTNIYYACTIKCLVPTPGFPSGWILPIQPFTAELWSILLLTQVFIVIMHIAFVLLTGNSRSNLTFPSISTAPMANMAHKYLNCIYHRKGGGRFHTKNVIFKITSVYIFQPVSSVNCRMFSLLSLFCLWISIAYSSGLSSILTQPFRLPPIDRIEDIIKQDLKVGTTSIPGYANTIVYDETENYRKFVSRLFEANQTHLFNLLKHAKNIALLIDKTLVGNFAITDYEDPKILSKFRIMKENILSMYIIGMARRNSVLLPSFNKLVDRIFESGLTYYWENEAIFLTSSQRIQKLLKNNRNNAKDVVVLKIIHVKGIFGLWFTGLLCSLIAFIGELYKGRRN